MPKPPKKPSVRDLEKIHRITKKKRRTIVFLPAGFIYEQRRLNPQKTGGIGNPNRVLTGTARELFVNLGIEKRGLGTKRQAANVRYEKNKRAKLPLKKNENQK